MEGGLAERERLVVCARRARGPDRTYWGAVDVESVLLACREGGNNVRPRVERGVCALVIPDVAARWTVDLGEDTAVWVDPEAKIAGV